MGRLAEVGEERGEPGDHGLVAAGEDGQRPVAGADVAPRDWRVDGVAACRACGRGDLAREGRGGARAVHQHAAGAEAGEGADGGVQNHRADVAGVSDHSEHHIGCSSHGRRRVREARASGDKALRLGRRASVHRDCEPSREEVLSHGAAHDADADPPDTRGPGKPKAAASTFRSSSMIPSRDALNSSYQLFKASSLF